MRIDKYLAERFGSRTKAAEAVSAGLVKVNGREVLPSYDVKDFDELTYEEPQTTFVSNGGYKLDKALKDFNFCVADKVVADIGASNGGFTDCLFKYGVQKVYCIDVGENQLDKSLKDKNIKIIDNFNARNLNSELFEEELDGVVIDVSFISLTYILKAVSDVLKDGAFVIALIKPQFECGSKALGKNGIVKDKNVRRQAIEKIYNFSVQCNLTPTKLTTAPLKDGKNIEYLILLIKNSQENISLNELNKYANL